MRKSVVIYLFSAIISLTFLAFVNQAVAAIQIDPPTKYTTLEELIKAIVEFLRNLALVVTAMVIVLAGYFFVTSMGDPAKVTRARHMVIYALIGLLIILAAEGIIALIERVIKGK